MVGWDACHGEPNRGTSAEITRRAEERRAAATLADELEAFFERERISDTRLGEALRHYREAQCNSTSTASTPS